MAVAKNPKTGKWYAKFRYKDYTGKAIQKKKEGFGRRADAQKWEKEFIQQHEGKEEITFSVAYQKYLADIAKRLKDSTVQRTKEVYKHYEALNNMPISEITPATIREWQNEHLLRMDQDTGKMIYTKKTIQLINTQLSIFFQWCKKLYGLSRNPVRDAGTITIKSIAEKPAAEKQIWQKEDFERYIKTIKREDLRLIFGIMYWCGLRRGEACGLRIKDVDLKNGILQIRQNRVTGGRIDTPKTKSSARAVTLPAHLVEEISTYIKQIYKPAQNELLFERILPDSISSIFLYYQRKCPGVPRIRLHDLRHSHASMLINAGFSPDVVADRLGHKNAQMVLEIYGHMYPEKRVEVTNALNKIYQE